MDLTSLPLISYIFDWENFGGTVIFALIGTTITLTYVVITWRDIVRENDPRHSFYHVD